MRWELEIPGDASAGLKSAIEGKLLEKGWEWSGGRGQGHAFSGATARYSRIAHSTDLVSSWFWSSRTRGYETYTLHDLFCGDFPDYKPKLKCGCPSLYRHLYGWPAALGADYAYCVCCGQDFRKDEELCGCPPGDMHPGKRPVEKMLMVGGKEVSESTAAKALAQYFKEGGK